MDDTLKKLHDELDLGADAGTERTLRALSETQSDLNPLKRDAIRAALLDQATHPTPMNISKPILWFIPIGALAVLVLVVVSGKGGLPSLDQVTNRRVAVAEREGFGALPELSVTATAADSVKSLAAAPAPMALMAPGAPNGAVAETAASGALLADAGVAMPAAVGGGTAGRATAIAVPPTMPIREQYLPPRVVYTFSGEMPTIPDELAVYRISPAQIPGDAALSILSSLGLRGFAGVAVQSLSFTESGDDPISWSLDGNSNTLSFWRQGPVYMMTKERMMAPGTESFPEPLPIPERKDISDADALAVAKAFLDRYGIDASRFGSPTVQRQGDYPCGNGMPCPMMLDAVRADAAPPEAVVTSAEGVSTDMIARSGIWWNPAVTVSYPALRDGMPVLDWGGSPMAGITLTIDPATRAATNGTIQLPAAADRSLYPSRAADEIRADALRGGLNPYWTDGGIFPPDEEKKRPTVTITLTSATLGLVERYAEDGRSRYLLPVVSFRGTLTDQYGNVSDYGTIVSALRATAGGVGDTVSGGSAGSAGTPTAAPLPEPMILREE